MCSMPLKSVQALPSRPDRQPEKIAPYSVKKRKKYVFNSAHDLIHPER